VTNLTKQDEIGKTFSSDGTDEKCAHKHCTRNLKGRGHVADMMMVNVIVRRNCRLERTKADCVNALMNLRALLKRPDQQSINCSRRSCTMLTAGISPFSYNSDILKLPAREQQ
jgi:hypothetical protein